MIILPDRNIPHARLLLPVHHREWRTPSQAQPKNAIGHENQTRFRLQARINDGYVVWDGWFDDRDDADAFLWALVRGTLRYERSLWDLPTPAWRPYIGYGAELVYNFVTTVFIVSGTSYSIPADCTGVSGLTGEFIDTIGAGAGGATSISSARALGGGGGAWSRITSQVLTPSASVTIQVGTGGAAKLATGSAAGNSGTDTWFNGANLAASNVGAKAGAGAAANSGTGGVGGAAASGIGTSKNSGGNGGASSVGTGGNSTSGGGGAAGPNGAGNSAATCGLSVTGAGASGDAGSGGAGSAGNGSGSSSNGGAGTEYDATHGSGGGSGGSKDDGVNPATAGTGGNYGGGGGGGDDEGAGSTTSGAGGPGLIVLAYTPNVSGGGKLALNMPMLGM